jgi:hypothetical protein
MKTRATCIHGSERPAPREARARQPAISFSPVLLLSCSPSPCLLNSCYPAQAARSAQAPRSRDSEDRRNALAIGAFIIALSAHHHDRSRAGSRRQHHRRSPVPRHGTVPEAAPRRPLSRRTRRRNLEQRILRTRAGSLAGPRRAWNARRRSRRDRVGEPAGMGDDRPRRVDGRRGDGSDLPHAVGRAGALHPAGQRREDRDRVDEAATRQDPGGPPPAPGAGSRRRHRRARQREPIAADVCSARAARPRAHGKGVGRGAGVSRHRARRRS